MLFKDQISKVDLFLFIIEKILKENVNFEIKIHHYLLIENDCIIFIVQKIECFLILQNIRKNELLILNFKIILKILYLIQNMD